jgi:DNA-binding XRE family transcriptional regulator
VGYSQQELADKVGTARSTIARIEIGASKPSLDLAFALADCLGARIELLFEPVPPIRFTQGPLLGDGIVIDVKRPLDPSVPFPCRSCGAKVPQDEIKWLPFTRREQGVFCPSCYRLSDQELRKRKAAQALRGGDQ